MNNEVMLFEAMRRKALEDELRFYKTTMILVTNNKLRCEEVWDDREAEQTKTVMQELLKRIMSLENDLKE